MERERKCSLLKKNPWLFSLDSQSDENTIMPDSVATAVGAILSFFLLSFCFFVSLSFSLLNLTIFCHFILLTTVFLFIFRFLFAFTLFQFVCLWTNNTSTYSLTFYLFLSIYLSIDFISTFFASSYILYRFCS
jgi:hypothetical protein